MNKCTGNHRLSTEMFSLMQVFWLMPQKKHPHNCRLFGLSLPILTMRIITVVREQALQEQNLNHTYSEEHYDKAEGSQEVYSQWRKLTLQVHLHFVNPGFSPGAWVK